MHMSDRKTELAEFLSARRAQLAPADAGLEEPGTRRRVPGLRREELARLAGVSVEYYTRLEQGRSRSASADVLDALAGALQLNDAERAHLHHLAKPQPAQRKRRRNVGTKAYHHPLVGGLTVTYQALNPSGDPDQTLFIYTTEPGSSDETALRLLANWHQGGEQGTRATSARESSES